MVAAKPVNLVLYDTAGQEDYDNLRPLSYPQSDVFLVCFSVISPYSFDNVASKWVPELRKHCPKVPIVLVGTKSDLRNDARVGEQLRSRGMKFVSKEDGVRRAEEIGALRYVECSALTQEGLREAFDVGIVAAVNGSKIKRGEDAGCCNIM